MLDYAESITYDLIRTIFNLSNREILMKLHDNSKAPSLLMRENRIQCAAYHAYADGSAHNQQGPARYFSGNPGSDCSFGEGDDDDIIDFLAEEAEPQGPKKSAIPWKILIADDDINVHDTTILALTGVQIHGRPLEFLHAYTAKEAYQILLGNADMALVLLDVVMETVDAGLKLVSVIRDELKNTDLRIVLRTGQPGYAPEQLVNTEFAIDGYTTKSKLTRSVLISVLDETLGNSSAPEGLPN